MHKYLKIKIKLEEKIPVTGAAENKPGNNKYLRCELFRFRFSSLSIKQVCAQLFNKYPALWGNDFNLRDLQGNGDRVEYRIHWGNYAVLQACIMYDYQGYMIFMYYLRLLLRRFLDRFCMNLSWKKLNITGILSGNIRNTQPNLK